MKVLQLRNNKKGFTLVEIIVVLIVIAILAAISLPALTGYIKNARLNKAEMAMADMRKALVAAAASIDVTKLGTHLEIHANKVVGPKDEMYNTFAAKVQRYLSDYAIKDGASKYVIILPKDVTYPDTGTMVKNAILYYFPNGLESGSAYDYKGEYYMYTNGVMEVFNQ